MHKMILFCCGANFFTLSHTPPNLSSGTTRLPTLEAFTFLTHVCPLFPSKPLSLNSIKPVAYIDFQIPTFHYYVLSCLRGAVGTARLCRPLVLRGPDMPRCPDASLCPSGVASVNAYDNFFVADATVGTAITSIRKQMTILECLKAGKPSHVWLEDSRPPQ
jgi:hypothetical protein